MNLYVRKWQKFQHYRRRNPPWIRLYQTLLDNPDWHALPSEDAKALVGIWLAVSRGPGWQTGQLPPLRDLAFAMRMDEAELHACLTRLGEWLEIRTDTAQEPGTATVAVAITEPAGKLSPEAQRLGAIFGTAFEAIRHRPLAATVAPSADLLCQRALSAGITPETIEDGLVWLSSPGVHGSEFVPAIKDPRELRPEWFERVADAKKRKASECGVKQATKEKDYTL